MNDCRLQSRSRETRFQITLDPARCRTTDDLPRYQQEQTIMVTLGYLHKNARESFVPTICASFRPLDLASNLNSEPIWWFSPMAIKFSSL